MKRGVFEIATREGRQPRQGWVIGSFGIHQEPSPFAGYTVTHLASGYAICPEFFLLRQARAFCERIEGLTDWSKLKPTKRACKPIGAAVVAAREAVLR